VAIARRLRAASLAGTALVGATAWAQSTEPPQVPKQARPAGAVITAPEVTVTGTREAESLSETPAAVGIIKGRTIEQDRPVHPNQIINQVPGAAVGITNGEGHTTAIRQPFTTAPVYLYLEDGIPTRSTGFFNHNALYEINIPQANGIEVTRGPGTALYGSDAIGGIVNVLTRVPPTKPEAYLSGELGSFGWWRVLTGGGSAHGDNAWRADLNFTHTDGWRESTAYDRQSGNLRWDSVIDAQQSLITRFAFSNIDQQTGANSPLLAGWSRNDFQNNPTLNYLPIAYRKVTAYRLSSTYEREAGNGLLTVTPYARDNSMDLLASFTLNSDPTLYTVQNQSVGLLAKWRIDFPDAMRARLIVGADIDYSPGSRDENALGVSYSYVSLPTNTRQFSAYTVGPTIYDYDVTFRGISPYLHAEISPTERLRLAAGLRYDYLGYRFDNSINSAFVAVPAGAVVPPATTPFPPVRVYGQAPDTTINFNQLSPKLGATYALGADTSVYAAYVHGFRVPSEGDLFRPAFGASPAAAQAQMQSALGLKPIKADQIQLGLRGIVGPLSYDSVVYNLTKRNDIVSQRDPFTTLTQRVNAGETRHRGVEVGLGAPFAKQFRLDVALSYSQQTYVDWVTTTGNFSGNTIESAPAVLANTRLTWLPQPGAQLQLEWVVVGSYWLDAANTQKYSGYNLFNLRGNWAVIRHVTLFGAVNNLFDTRFADSGQLSGGTQPTPLLSPGLPRAFYAGVELAL
jgi:outer membrane receptor protein involved in Fe transport